MLFFVLDWVDPAFSAAETMADLSLAFVFLSWRPRKFSRTDVNPLVPVVEELIFLCFGLFAAYAVELFVWTPYLYILGFERIFSKES
jgi:hypothetical protein